MWDVSGKAVGLCDSRHPLRAHALRVNRFPRLPKAEALG